MAGDQWHCSKCTFLHLFPGQRCTMCNALRVSKEEMRNFVQGKNKNAASSSASSSESNDDNGDGGGRDDGGTDSSNNGSGRMQQRFPQHHAAEHHAAAAAMQNNNVAPLPNQATAASSTNNHHQHRPTAVNPYAKQSSRPSSSFNNVARVNNAPSQGNVLANQQSRPPTANPYSNNRTTTNNVSTQKNNSTTNRFGYSNNENNHLPQQQQRPPVNNPYNKSMSASASTVSHSNNAPIQNVPPTNSFTAAAAPSNPQPRITETWQHTTTNPNRNITATTTNNVNNSQQNNQNLHRFFTGAARPTTSAQQPSQVRTTSKSGVVGNTNNNALPPAAAAASKSTNNRQQQRFSLSAKKQLPYVQGPVLLCTATCHNWIYPSDDKYPERTYQLEMSESAILHNTLVSLPTGLGKTLIAAVVMYNYYRWFPEGKVIFCAPTRPLVTQQIQACYKIMGIPERHTAEISGRVPSTSRKQMWENKRVFFCTPQTLVKDIEEDRCDASKIVCMVLDEAHRATGMHTFALLPNMIQEAGAKFRLLALSATPGTDIKSIQAVVETLKISKIEARTEDDPNVKRYIHNREEEVISVNQPDVIKILDKKLLEFVRQPLERLRSVNAATRLMGDSANLSPFAVMKAREEYVNRTGDHRMYHTFEALRSLVDVRMNLKNHGIQFALQNIARKEMEAKGPLRSIFHSDEFKALKGEMQAAAGDPTECLSKNNPKYEKLTDVLLEHFQRKQAISESTRVIVFSQLRESVMGIVSMLSSQNAELLKPTPFVGQSKKKESETNPGQEVAGMNQAEQQRILQQFNKGVFNILVCTCVGEEGLDIGDVDLIVNFDILKSAIRSIQRTGRTGRKRNGRVVFLVSEGQEERSYRDSVTNSKKIARALKDPSVFILCQNSPMLPNEPAVLKQKMVVDDFHMSQVGGHTPKTRGRGKTGRSSKRNGDKVAAVDDSWRLAQAQQNERMHLFGNLPYSSHSEYESETTQGGFPASLRKKYLKARRGSQQSNTGRGRSSTILASFEKLYIRPTERRESRCTIKKRSFDYGDDDNMVCNSSVEDENPSVAFDVESDCGGFAGDLCNEPSNIISEKDDDDNQIECFEVSPESINKDSLGAIFGTISVKHSGSLNSQQMAFLFDSEDQHHCYVRAPPPFGDLHYDERSESSSFSSESSKQLSQLSAKTMDDDDLCAYFENSQLPTGSPQKSAAEKQLGSMGDVGEDNFNDGTDFRAEKESISNSQSDPTEDNVGLNSGVTKETAQNTSQHLLYHTGVENDQGCPIGMANLSESLLEAENRGCDNIQLERDDVDERPDSEVLDSIGGGGLSPIPHLSQVAAFRLPTPPPSSSDEDDDDDSDNQSGTKDEAIEEDNNVTLGVNGQDLATSNPSPDRTSWLHLESFSNEFEDNQCFGGNDVQEEDDCKDKIDPLQLPTQYSSSSDDDDESEGQSECNVDAESQSVAPNDVVPSTNEAGNNMAILNDQKYAKGTKISKEFKDPKSGLFRPFQGEVVAFYSQDNQDKLYNVVFEDGDNEDMEEGEIERHLARNEETSNEDVLSSQRQPDKEENSHHLSQMFPDDLTDTPVVQRNVGKTAGAISRMSLDSLTDTPVVQRRMPERKSRMSMDLTDTPVQHFPERKRLRPNNEVPKKDMSKHAEKVPKQDRLKQRIEEKYRCRFLDTEAANDDSDSGDEEEDDDDEMSQDGFINDTSQLGFTQDDLDRLNESVEECDHEESDTLHRQLNHQQSVHNQFKTPILNRKMKLPTSQQSQTSLPPSQRGLGNMNFIRSVIDHCRNGGDTDDIETEYHRLVGESSQDMSMSQIDMSMSQIDDETKVDSQQPLVQQVDERQPAPAMATANINNNNHPIGSQQTNKIAAAAIAPSVSKECVIPVAKAPVLTAEQKSMIEAKRQAALRLRQQKQKMNQPQTQVRFNPYAK